MKKYLYLASAASLLMASCSDELALKNSQDQVLEGKSKVLATMTIGEDAATRTYVKADGQGKYPYYWSVGDALGVIGVDANDYVYNAFYAYANPEPATEGTFVSQMAINNEGQYYGYYPYNADVVYTPASGTTSATIQLTIQGNQSFNNNKGNIQQTNPAAQAVGSFANGLAPSVAVSSGVENDQIEFSFKPQAGYIVVPVVGYTTVNSVSISLSQLENGQETGYNYQQMNGNLVVDMSNPEAAVGVTPVEPSDYNPGPNGSYYYNVKLASDTPDFANNPNYVTTLNLGKGVALDPTTPTNFWFVVPANLELNGWTLNLYFDGDFTKVADSRELSNLTNGTVGRNQTRYFWKEPVIQPNPEYIPFTYNPTGAYIISKPYQFVEYAYLVSNNVSTFYENWNTLPTKKLTDLEDMLFPTAFDEEGQLKGSITADQIRPAIIIADLNNFQTSISTYVGEKGEGYWETELPPYYQNVYGYFLEGGSGELPTIGGAYAYTMSGIQQSTDEEGNPVYSSISGLTVNAGTSGGMFTGVSTTAQAVVSKLLLNGVNVKGTYFLGSALTQQSANTSFSELTVGSTCQLNGGTDGALFGRTAAGYLRKQSTLPVINESDLKFAAVFNVNANYDFTDTNMPVNDPQQFGSFEVQTNYSGYYLTINSETAETDAEYIIFNEKNNYQTNAYYSVIDNASPTANSYWTGTVATAARTTGYAEDLAYAAQTTGFNGFTMKYNLNLMGYDSEHNVGNHWWANDVTGHAVILAGNDLTISNVYIDGYANADDEAPATTALSLFGFAGSAYNLDIKGITIVNESDNASIAILGNFPFITVYNNMISAKYVTVTGVTYDVTASAYEEVGGLYQYVTDDTYWQVANTNNVSATAPEGLASSLLYGPMAGVYKCSVSASSNQNDPAVVKNIYLEEGEDLYTYNNPYGKIYLTLDFSNTTSIPNAYVYLNGFDENVEYEINPAGIGIGNYVNIKTSENGTYKVYRYEGNGEFTPIN